MGNIMSFFFPPSRELPAPADAPLTKEEDTLAREVTEVEDTLAREVKEAEDTPAREVKVVEDTPAREVKEAEAPLAAEEEQLEAAAPVSAEDIVVNRINKYLLFQHTNKNYIKACTQFSWLEFYVKNSIQLLMMIVKVL